MKPWKVGGTETPFSALKLQLMDNDPLLHVALFEYAFTSAMEMLGQAAVRFFSLARRVRLSSSAESEMVLMISNSRLQAWLKLSAISCIGSGLPLSS